MSSHAREMILAIGISMLAVKTMTARNSEWVSHRYTTPDQMVSLWTWKSFPLSITGRTLAGT